MNIWQKTLIIGLFLAGLGYSNSPSKLARILVDKSADYCGHVMWTESPMELVYHMTPLPEKKSEDNAITVSAAANEYEPIQLIVNPVCETESVWFRIEPLEGPGIIPAENIYYNKVDYVTLLNKKSNNGEARCVPEILSDDSLLLLKSMTNNPIWITIKVPENSKPGLYKGKISLMRGNKIWDTVNVHLNVYNFTLPKLPCLRSMHDPVATIPSLGNDEYVYGDCRDIFPKVIKNYIYYTKNTEQIIDMFNENVQAHRMDLEYLNPLRPRVKIKGDKIKVYFDEWAKKVGPQIQKRGGLFFTIPCFIDMSVAYMWDFKWYGLDVLHPQFNKIFPEYCRQLSEGLTKHGWKKMALLHFWNEIREDGYPKLAKVCKMVKDVDPELLCFTSSHADRAFDKEIKELGLDTMIAMWKSSLSSSAIPLLAKKGVVAQSKQQEGDIGGSLISPRLFQWNIKRYNYPGLVLRIWGLAHWSEMRSIIQDRIFPPKTGSTLSNSPEKQKTEGKPKFFSPGNGLVLYPSTKKNAPPLNSIRWEINREGLDDYDYLAILEQRVDSLKKSLSPKYTFTGMDRVKEVIAQVIGLNSAFTEDISSIYQARGNLGREIETLFESPLVLLKTEPYGDDPADNFTRISIKGTVEKGAKVSIHSQELEPDREGFFHPFVMEEVPLEEHTYFDVSFDPPPIRFGYIVKVAITVTLKDKTKTLVRYITR
ncbi:MAG: glycoside hydrolase domain-containing protein [bacterium]